MAEAQLTPPTANNGLLAVFQRRYLLRLLVRREINARYQGSFLGLLWSYINPLAQFLVYWAIIGGVLNLHDEVPNFPIHLFAGLVIVHFFTETFGAGTRSIVRNKSIVVKMPLPREMFPVATMLVSLYHVGPQLVVLVIACVLSGWTPDPVGMLAMVIALLMIMAIGTAVALVFSVANVFFRDFGNIVNVLQMLVRFGVPMIYPYSMVESRFGRAADFYLLNPLADAVLLFQRAFWVGVPDKDHSKSDIMAEHLPDNLLLLGLGMLGVGLVMLVGAQLIFNKLDNKIPERL
ncbi:ABC-2 type transport system permease protein [Nocardioides thalensis]|uniref:Transport permease protein n=1 Tax=Nocardioides thalensis TaxID=1914755 RepID=A0A853C6P5_9ACTN|nr:ABC transporter permease [Nocardioides thalensis]NYJ02352.1 ABC-2 type transport system permease protein [Nocardioides thalensis]